MEYKLWNAYKIIRFFLTIFNRNDFFFRSRSTTSFPNKENLSNLLWSIWYRIILHTAVSKSYWYIVAYFNSFFIENANPNEIQSRWNGNSFSAILFLCVSFVLLLLLLFLILLSFRQRCVFMWWSLELNVAFSHNARLHQDLLFIWIMISLRVY